MGEHNYWENQGGSPITTNSDDVILLESITLSGITKVRSNVESKAFHKVKRFTEVSAKIEAGISGKVFKVQKPMPEAMTEVFTDSSGIVFNVQLLKGTTPIFTRITGNEFWASFRYAAPYRRIILRGF